MWTKIISSTALCLSLTVSSAFAQEASKPQTEPTDVPEPQIGQPYLGSNEKDWDVICIKSDQETDPCEIRQLVLDQNKDPMIEITLERISGQQGAVAGATVIVPLETILTVPLTLAIDGAKGKQYPYTFCNSVGCIARIGLTQSDVNAMKRGKMAELSLSHLTVSDRLVTIPVSLSGFTAAYDKATVKTIAN
jgi:invasion protein IalB